MRIGRLNSIIIFRALTDYKITCALPAFVVLLKLRDYMLLPIKHLLYEWGNISTSVPQLNFRGGPSTPVPPKSPPLSEHHPTSAWVVFVVDRLRVDRSFKGKNGSKSEGSSATCGPRT